MSDSVYERLLGLFREAGAAVRVIEHAAEGRTEVVSQMRGNSLRQAAKAMVLMVKQGKKSRRYFLCVVPGDCRVDLEAVRRMADGTHVLFAPADRARELSGCEMGAVPPVSFHGELELLVDPGLLENDEIVFNAGRLDRSIAVDRDSYVRAARPTVAPIAIAEVSG